MNWSDERYVRLYTRDTADWMALSFDAQALLSLLLRKADRSGSIACGKHGKRAAAIVIGHARDWSRLEPALEELLVDGVLDFDGESLTFRNFVEAQEAKASDRKRQRDSREKRGVTSGHDESRDVTSDGAGSQPVTQRDDESRNVTECHDGSRGVTRGHSVLSLAVPSLAVPSQELPAADATGPAPGLLADGDKPTPTPPTKPDRKRTPVQLDGEAWLAKARSLSPPPEPDPESKLGKQHLRRLWSAYQEAHAAFGAQKLLDSLDGHARDRFWISQGLPGLLSAKGVAAGLSARDGPRARQQSPHVGINDAYGVGSPDAYQSPPPEEVLA